MTPTKAEVAAAVAQCNRLAAVLEVAQPARKEAVRKLYADLKARIDMGKLEGRIQAVADFKAGLKQLYSPQMYKQAKSLIRAADEQQQQQQVQREAQGTPPQQQQQRQQPLGQQMQQAAESSAHKEISQEQKQQQEQQQRQLSQHAAKAPPAPATPSAGKLKVSLRELEVPEGKGVCLVFAAPGPHFKCEVRIKRGAGGEFQVAVERVRPFPCPRGLPAATARPMETGWRAFKTAQEVREYLQQEVPGEEGYRLHKRKRL